MSELAWLLTGLLIGGRIAVTVLCCAQINCISDYKQEIRGLRQEPSDKN